MKLHLKPTKTQRTEIGAFLTVVLVAAGMFGESHLALKAAEWTFNALIYWVMFGVAEG